MPFKKCRVVDWNVHFDVDKQNMFSFGSFWDLTRKKKNHHWAGRECKSSRKWADLYYIWQEPGDQFASAPPESSCNMIKVTNKGKAACKLARVVAVFAPLKACTAVLSAAFACRTMDPVMETTVPHWLNIKKKKTRHTICLLSQWSRLHHH